MSEPSKFENFKVDENERKFFKQVENTMDKGEIAHNKQISPFLSVFKRLVWQTCKNQGLSGKGLRQIQSSLTLSETRGPRWPWIAHLIF